MGTYECASYAELIFDEETGRKRWAIHCEDGAVENLALDDIHSSIELSPNAFEEGTIIKIHEPIPIKENKHKNGGEKG